MTAQWSTPAGTGGHVEVDGSLCIVLVQPRLNDDDVRITVTDVDRLCEALHNARTMRDSACGSCGRIDGHAETCRWYRWAEPS